MKKNVSDVALKADISLSVAGEVMNSKFMIFQILIFQNLYLQ